MNQPGFFREAEPKLYIDFLKEFVYVIASTGSPKPLGQALAGWKLAGVDAVVLRQNFFFSEDLFLLLRPLLDSVNPTDPCDQ